MNTNDEKIQWHPAFEAALQIELGEETKYLEFDSEHLLSKKPMQIDGEDHRLNPGGSCVK